MSDIEREAQFLIERLREFENENMDEPAFRDWNGHVCPSIARLELLLEAARQAPASEEVEPVAMMSLGRASRLGISFEYRETYCRGWNDCLSAHPPAKVPEGLTEKALELCRAVENEEEFPPAKFALRCLMLVNQIHKLAATPTPATTPQPADNWKLMPLHATPETIERGKRAHKEEFLYHEDASLNIQQVWKAMAAIAPNPPAEGAE